jgi:RNA polymerase sigma-70 factor, ECF subfamily
MLHSYSVIRRALRPTHTSGERMERELVERAMHGDEGAFETLVGRIGDSMHSVARRILRDTTLAQDATQQALLDAWRYLPTLRDPDRFEAWAHRLLVHACYAEARRERRHRGNLRLLTRDEFDRDTASSIAVQDQLDRGFRRLSVEHRTVIVLVHYLGLSLLEAAERMGTPAGTARSRLHYALRHLRSAIEADARPTAKRGTA